MADVQSDNATREAPPPCAPCRGTGRIVSRLGGSAQTVMCPWCEGTGHVIPAHDAQAHWKSGGGDDEPPPLVA